MKAIAVKPGQPNTMHLKEVEDPRLDEIPGGRGVLVKILRVGVDGTDKEINAAEYGDAPDGDDFLITGHESLGRVIEVGDNVPSHIKPGSVVVATVRRPGMSIYDSIGLQDMTTDDVYFERGINKRHGYLCEYYVEDHQYVVPLPNCLSETGVLLEPLTVAEKAVEPGVRDPAPAEGLAAPPSRRARFGHRRPAHHAGAAPARHRGHLHLAAAGALPQQRPDRGDRRHLRLHAGNVDRRRPRRSTGRSTSSSRPPASALLYGTRPRCSPRTASWCW